MSYELNDFIKNRLWRNSLTQTIPSSIAILQYLKCQDINKQFNFDSALELDKILSLTFKQLMLQ